MYGALPHPGLPADMSTPSRSHRAFPLRKAPEEMSKIFARKQVNAAVRERNGPDTSDTHSTPFYSHLLVYRPEKDMWEGPFTLLDIHGEVCTVLLPLPSVPSKFRTTIVKLHILDGNTDIETQNSTPQPAAMAMTVKSTLNTSICDVTLDFRPDLFLARNNCQSPDNNTFADARRKEVDGLINRGVCAIAKWRDSNGLLIYRSRFVDTVKKEVTPEAFKNPRLLVQGFNDKHGLLTHAPTVQHASQ